MEIIKEDTCYKILHALCCTMHVGCVLFCFFFCYCYIKKNSYLFIALWFPWAERKISGQVASGKEHNSSSQPSVLKGRNRFESSRDGVPDDRNIEMSYERQTKLEQGAAVLHLVVPALWDPRDRSPPASSVHGIFQARILEWVATSFSRASSLSRDQTHVSCVPCVSSWIV